MRVARSTTRAVIWRLRGTAGIGREVPIPGRRAPGMFGSESLSGSRQMMPSSMSLRRARSPGPGSNRLHSPAAAEASAPAGRVAELWT
jgi:hypothetical protein